MQNRRSGIYIIVILGCLVLVLGALIISGGFRSEVDVPKPTETVQVTPTAVPTPTPTPTPTPAPTPYPNNGKPDVAAQSAVDSDYFKDSVFVGNSLVDGLYLYGGITGSTWLSGTGVSIYNIRTQELSDKHGGTCMALSALGTKQYGKVYVYLGMNEIGSGVDNFIKAYTSLLSDIRALQPSADIYVISLTPVSANKSAGSKDFTKANVLSFNKAIYQLCAENGYWYLDCYSPLADKDGYLPANATTDGVHFATSYYPKWADVIRTHYVIHN